jgi:hypothetical protein
MKQTAVEWLHNNLKSHFEHDGDLLEVVKMSFEQAKEMVKQQIQDAYRINPNNEIWSNSGIDYYNETFKS